MKIRTSLLSSMPTLLLLLSACGPSATNSPEASGQSATPAVAEAVPSASPAEHAEPEQATTPAAAQVVVERFSTQMTPEDNIDSLASWTTPTGETWVFATAKSTDQMVIYDGDTGERLRSFGERGDGEGQFRRPNGVFVIDDLLVVVERDNRRAQFFALPGLEPMGHFGSDDLIKPYGLWMEEQGGSYRLFITDAYELEDGSVPPLTDLDARVKLYRVQIREQRVQAELVHAFGDVGERGALRVVESIWGDRHHDRLMIAEEDESWANEIKVYDLTGSFSGQIIGSGVLDAQAEGIAQWACGDGSGYWLTTAQDKGLTRFHLFDRASLEHVGAFTGQMVANTDGIWLQQQATPRFPNGVLYAVHDDQGMVAFDWGDIATALSLKTCG